MKEFTLVFTTRHRKGYTIEKDYMLICNCITEYTTNFKYIYNGKELMVFHIYDADKEDRHKILISIVSCLHCDGNYKSIDLQSYTNN